MFTQFGHRTPSIQEVSRRKTSSHAHGSNAGTTSKNLRKRNINARIHIGAQIAPSSFDNSLCVLFAVHRVSRRSSSSALQTFRECQLDRSNEAMIHLLELSAGPKTTLPVKIEDRGHEKHARKTR